MHRFSFVIACVSFTFACLSSGGGTSNPFGRPCLGPFCEGAVFVASATCFCLFVRLSKRRSTRSLPPARMHRCAACSRGHGRRSAHAPPSILPFPSGHCEAGRSPHVCNVAASDSQAHAACRRVRARVFEGTSVQSFKKNSRRSPWDRLGGVSDHAATTSG